MFITEASSKSGYNDEHATAHLWNHITSSPDASKFLRHENPDLIRIEIEKAKDEPEHPLNVKNAPKEGFHKGVRNEDAYYNELHHAADAVHALANHPSFKEAVRKRMRASVAGHERVKLSDLWKNNGASEASSTAVGKADIVIGDRSGEHHAVSLKKGNAQLMSAEPQEFISTYDHATNEHMRVNPEFTQRHKNEVMHAIRELGKHLRAMAGKKRAVQEKMAKEGDTLLKAIHTAHPGLEKHVHFESATGHGKFGYNAPGTARYLVTSKASGSHVHDTLTNNEPIIANTPRVSLPKTEGRPAVVRTDYKAISTKKK